MMKTATKILVAAAAAAGIGHAAWAPFPGPGDNPVVDLFAYHDPGFHTFIRIWYYAAPAVALLFVGFLGLSVCRVWFEVRAGASAWGTLPPWPVSPDDHSPSVIVGELHHPTGKSDSSYSMSSSFMPDLGKASEKPPGQSAELVSPAGQNIGPPSPEQEIYLSTMDNNCKLHDSISDPGQNRFAGRRGASDG